MQGQFAASITDAATPLIEQDIEGCLDARIGAAGLPPATLTTWLDKLAPALEDLKQAYRTGSLPLLRVPETTDDIAPAEVAIARLSRGARPIV